VLLRQERVGGTEVVVLRGGEIQRWKLEFRWSEGVKQSGKATN
jgi:hypothetical protein